MFDPTIPPYLTIIVMHIAFLTHKVVDASIIPRLRDRTACSALGVLLSFNTNILAQHPQPSVRHGGGPPGGALPRLPSLPRSAAVPGREHHLSSQRRERRSVRYGADEGQDSRRRENRLPFLLPSVTIGFQCRTRDA